MKRTPGTLSIPYPALLPFAASALLACTTDNHEQGLTGAFGGAGGSPPAEHGGSAGTGYGGSAGTVSSAGGSGTWSGGSAGAAVVGNAGAPSGGAALGGASGAPSGAATIRTGGSGGAGIGGRAGAPGMSGAAGASAAGGAKAMGTAGAAGLGTAGSAGASAGSAGAGGGGAAGSTATGGAGGSAGSVGCGVTGSPASGTYRIDVNGLEREFNIKIPANYDSRAPYRLVFAWHWLTGTAARVQSAGYYGLESRSAGTTIFVAGQGLDSNGDMEYGWPDTGGRDVAFAKALLDWVSTRYCVDTTRIFSTGWSYGGMFSNRLGCVMGDVFRAIAPMSGNGPSRSTCVGKVAAWISHGDQDPTVSLASGQASRDYWANANHCTMPTMPTDPSPCVAYQGCDAGFPVHWCVFPGGHTQPSFGSAAIWNFFSQF